MLHGADKGFVESGKYGKPGKYFLSFLDIFLWNLFNLYACDDLLYNHREAAINTLRV